jgi:hypothetical protein
VVGGSGSDEVRRTDGDGEVEGETEEKRSEIV